MLAINSAPNLPMIFYFPFSVTSGVLRPVGFAATAGFGAVADSVRCLPAALGEADAAPLVNSTAAATKRLCSSYLN